VLRFSLLGSGSSGNATVISTEAVSILIDNGLSYRQFCLRAAAIGFNPESLSAVMITHEHADHVAGVGVLARKLGIPVYLTPATHESLPELVGTLQNVVHFEAGDSIPIGNLEIQSFAIAHDAADPVSFAVRSNGAKLGLATDLGHPSNVVKQCLASSNALVIESNYCPELLRKGHYPAQVQQRIRSRVGHLSNQDMNSLLCDLLHEHLHTVVLVHISENNNHPELARSMAARALGTHPARLHVAAQDAPTPFFEVG
jgi:phosphoribosyl 1,2-cyclic phosphodiesterase